MGQHHLSGNPPIAVTFRRSARARQLSLRVSRLDGRVTLTLPPRVPEAEGVAFLRDREGWLRRHLGDVAEETRLRHGGILAVEGQSLVLTPARVRAPRVAGETLLVPDDPDRLERSLLAFLRTLARDRLAEASDRYAAAIGRPYGKITLRDTRSRWGSCTSRGDLMYSWRLIMAPPAVLDYVAAHEVAHLERMDHSPAFWEIVARLCPDHARYRAWLRTEGTALHRVRFGD